MKILALGGSGGMGRYAVHSLYKNPKIEKIFVADLNASSAKDFSSSFNNKVDGFGLDVTNESIQIKGTSCRNLKTSLSSKKPTHILMEKFLQEQ